MKAKFFFLCLVVFLVYILSVTCRAQEEMDFEEFMGMMSETFTDQQLDELSFLVPWEIKVTAYGYGDFSGDYKDDVVLAIREKYVTPPKSVDVYFFENLGDTTYKLISKKNHKYIELNIEVAFLIKSGQCYVTSRDANNWYFTSYEIKDSRLRRVETEMYPIVIQKAGN
jgi:hypothetical protein